MNLLLAEFIFLLPVIPPFPALPLLLSWQKKKQCQKISIQPPKKRIHACAYASYGANANSQTPKIEVITRLWTSRARGIRSGRELELALFFLCQGKKGQVSMKESPP